MRHLPLREQAKIASRFHLELLAITTIVFPGCAGGGASSGTLPPPPPAVSVSVSPPTGSLLLGKNLSFTASVTGTANVAVTWAVNGIAGGSGSVGTVSADGRYTAPIDLPAPSTVQVTATSVASPSSTGSAQVTITSDIAVGVSTQSAAVELGARQSFVATLTSAGQPDASIRWLLSGAACPASCGSVDASGNYTAPQILPAQPVLTLTAQSAADPSKRAAISITITITATPLADTSKKAQATLTVQAGIGVSLTPVSATLATTRRLTFAVQVNGTANSSVSWSVNGVPAGNAALGQVCVAASSPCSPAVSSSAGQIDFVAPAILPTPNPVTLLATSVADATKFATAQVTILNHVVVSVLPGSVTLAPGATQSFTASILRISNQSVIWQLQGPACATSAGCGLISAGGLYAAPATAPSPNTLQVVAVSSDDTSQFALANITLTSGASLQSLHPASVYAGGALGFVLRVDGGGFRTNSPGPGSTLLVGGSSRTTSCLSASECTAAVFPSDVALPGSLNVQLQNPDGSFSNILPLVVASPNLVDDTIALSGAAPNAGGKDIVVVEPTTAGVSLPGDDVDLDIAALGNFSVVANTCTLGGNPVVLTRPTSGAATFDMCAFAQSGLDTSMAYTVTGNGDVAVIAKQPAGHGIIHLIVQVQSTAQPGARTLFIQNLNLDRAAASGVLEAQ